MTKVNENNNLTSCGKQEDVVTKGSTTATENEIEALRALFCEPFPSETDTDTSSLLPGRSSPQDSLYSTSDSENESLDDNASFFSNLDCFSSCLRFFNPWEAKPRSAANQSELSTEPTSRPTI